MSNENIYYFASFILGALCASALSIGAERYGSKAAGIFGGYPATLTVALALHGLNSGNEAARAVALVVPLQMGFLALSLLAFIIFARRGLLSGCGALFGIWSILSLLGRLLLPMTILISVVGFAVLLVHSIPFSHTCYSRCLVLSGVPL